MLSVTLWGVIAFGVQTLCGLLLPVLFSRHSQLELYGSFSFFFWLIHPAMWLDFTGNLNAGLLSRLPRISRFHFSQVARYYSATILWWFLIWAGMWVAVRWEAVSFFSEWELVGLLAVPVMVSIGYYGVVHQYYQQKLTAVYHYQILLGISWVAGIGLFSETQSLSRATCYSTLGTGLLFVWITFRHLSLSLEPPGRNLNLNQELADKQTDVEVVLARQKPWKAVYGWKNYVRDTGRSLTQQSLFFFQTALGIMALQVDRLLIAHLFSWTVVSWYVIPIGLLFKYPALVSFFNKPLITRLSFMLHQEQDTANGSPRKDSISSQYPEVQRWFLIISLGNLVCGSLLMYGVMWVYQPLVSWWLTPEFARESWAVVRPVMVCLPYAVLMMTGQIFMVALKQDRLFNGLSIACTVFHWGMLGLGGYLRGLNGIGLGFVAEALTGLGLLFYLSRIFGVFRFVLGVAVMSFIFWNLALFETGLTFFNLNFM
ncbi:MAG: hypothetical protein HQM12_20120 [SAR324 cluster bacterium]|nr:hypothetical protein [SAR324 cluster bacterium]